MRYLGDLFCLFINHLVYTSSEVLINKLEILLKQTSKIMLKVKQYHHMLCTELQSNNLIVRYED